MTTSTFYEQTGISIVAWKPTIAVGASYTPHGILIRDDLHFFLSSYSHTIDVFGGFISASISLNIPSTEIGPWLGRLGSHLEVHNFAGVIAWEGYVDRITVTVGALSIVVGPLSDVGNRGEIVYSTVDTTTSPPTMGVRTRTAIANNADSQDLYGIIHKVLSVGGTTDVDADQIRDTWLADNALPITSHQFSGGGGGEVTVTLECLGYVHWLKFYPYNQTTTTGTMDLDAKIQAVLTADPNSLFSTDYSQIVANTLAVKQWEDTDSTAFAVVQALTAMGDTNDDRYLFGIYENQRARYEQMPTDLAYIQRLADQDQRVWTPAGSNVDPWDVRPGKWLMYADLLTGGASTSLAPSRSDYRFEFIESVSYTAPQSIQHYGGKVTTLPQMLARLGLGGMAG